MGHNGPLGRLRSPVWGGEAESAYLRPAGTLPGTNLRGYQDDPRVQERAHHARDVRARVAQTENGLLTGARRLRPDPGFFGLGHDIIVALCQGVRLASPNDSQY